MREIEKGMCKAIADRRNWERYNTRVERAEPLKDSEGNILLAGYCGVWLFGKHIADVLDDGTTAVNLFTLNAWPTNTTLSRLRALSVDVCVRKGVVYLRGEPI